MLIFEHAHFRFLFREFCARLIELVSEETGRVLGALLPLLEILRDEEIRQFGRGRLCHLRIAARVINVEGRELLIIAVRQFDLDVLAHLLHQIVRALVLPVLGVQTERVNDSKKAGAAQDLLRNAV